MDKKQPSQTTSQAIIAILFVILINCTGSPLFLTAQETGAPETVTHFILLVDTTPPLSSILRTYSQNTKNTEFYTILKTALENNPYNQLENDTREKDDEKKRNYRTFRKTKDIVSLVLFRFPRKESGKISEDSYFYPASARSIVDNFSNSAQEIKDFLKNWYRETRPKATSPIKFARTMVFPYLCEENKWGGLPDEKNKIVDRIVLITISDEKNVPIDLDYFEKEEIRSTFGKWHDKYKRLLNDIPINAETLLLYNRSTEEVSAQAQKIPGQIYFDYTIIEPVLNGVDWKTKDETTLERTISNSKNNDEKIYWKGDSGVTTFKSNKVKYTGNIQWAQRQNSGNPLEWHKLEENPQGQISFKNKIPPIEISIQKNPVDDTQFCEDLKKFKPSIRYRVEITDFMEKNNIAYPFEFRTYTTISTVTYSSKKFSNGQCQAPPYYVHRMGRVRKDGVITDERLIQIYKESGKAGVFTPIRASTWSGDSAGLQAKRFINTIIAFFSVFLGFLAVLLIYLVFIRKPKIKPVMLQDKSEITVDFSRENREIQTMAFLTLHNTRKLLAKVRRRKPFALSIQFSTDLSREDNRVKYDSDQLFTIEKIVEEQTEAQKFLMQKTGNQYQVEIPEARAGDQFKIQLNPNTIRDLDAGLETNSMTFNFGYTNIAGYFLKNGTPDAPVQMKSSKKNRSNHTYTLGFTPETGTLDISYETLHDEDNKDFIFDRKTQKYTIPYSTKRPVRKLFKITISNSCRHKYSQPLQEIISWKVLEGITPRDKQDIFYLLDSEEWDGKSPVPAEYASTLGWNREKEFYCYIKNDDIAENPVIPRNFQFHLQINGNTQEGYIKNISVTRSMERTEAVIQINDIKGIKLLNTENDPEIFTPDNELLQSGTPDDNAPATLKVQVPGSKRKSILENRPTDLFTLRFRNNCTTKTGYYEWKIENIHLGENENLLLDEAAGKKTVTTDSPENSGKIEDRQDDFKDIKFTLNGETLKIIAYEITLNVEFTIQLAFFPDGHDTREVRYKQVNVNVTVEGVHNVIPNYLIIDFGTSAIAVENCDNSIGPNFEKKTNILPLKTPEIQLKSEDSLLPSIMNINEGKIIINEDFVTLPANKSLVSTKPEHLISAIKLMILEGERKIPVPKGFKCEGEGGTSLEYGDDLDLGTVLKAAYKNLKNNYIRQHVKDYRKLIVTYPNVYNETHKEFLSEILNEVYVNKGDSVYPENISMVSESNAVLYDYLKQVADDERESQEESVVVCDIGGGTLDVTWATITWEKNESYPANIDIPKRDGIAFAGEVLDKAIALQVHHILTQYEEKIDKPNEPQETGTDIFSNEAGAVPPADEKEFTEENRKKFYQMKISRNGDAAGNEKNNNLLQIMFEFKYYHILQFKKDMSDTADGGPVRICLGENTHDKGLGLIEGNERALSIEFTGKSFQSVIKNESGYLYLYLKKNDWLELPYLKRYKQLFKEKIYLFFGADEKNIQEKVPAETTFVLSGRTSLWPSIPKAIEELSGRPPVYISGPKADKKGVKLKRAVTDGALQKVVDWPHIECHEPKSIGAPALHYKPKAGNDSSKSWKVQILDKKKPYEANLTNSPYFQLGIKTSMDFIPFIGGACYERDIYCDGKKKVKISMEPAENKIGWKFFLEQPEEGKINKVELPVDPRLARNSLNLKGTIWPIRKIQLPDTAPEDFNECT